MFLGAENNLHDQRREEERLRISQTLFEKYRPAGETAPANKPQVVRPLEDYCRQCTQRPPLGKSKYCRHCIELRARIDDEQSRFAPGMWYFALFGVAAFLIYLALSPFLAPESADFQRPVVKSSVKTNK
jgi:hypothetical protein